MGSCLVHQSIVVSEAVSTTSKSSAHTTLLTPVPKQTPRASLENALSTFNCDAPFSGYNFHVWSHMQQQNKQCMQDRVNGVPCAQRSSSIAILQRISLERLSMSAEVSLLDDLLAKPNDVGSAAGASGNGFRIGCKGRRLSRILNDVYSKFNNVTPRHEGEANEYYLKRIFSLVDSEGKGKVSSVQAANLLFKDASHASIEMMMAAADQDKDGYLSEREFVSFLIHIERERDLLQSDCTESKLAKLSSTSESDNAGLGSLAGVSTQHTPQKGAHRLKSLRGVRMRWIEVTNLCSQSSRTKCIAISPDGNLYAVSHRYDNVAHVYMISNGAEVRRLVGHQGSLLGIIFSSDRKHVVTAARDNLMVLWDHTIGLECHFSEHPGIVTAVAVSFDGKFVFSGCQDNLVRKFTVSKAKIRAVLPNIPCEARGVIVALATQNTKNDLIAFSRSCDQCAYIANAYNLQPIGQLSGHDSLVWKVSFNADDSLLFTCCERKIILWDGACSPVRIFISSAVATSASSVDGVLWTTAVFASREHCGLLFCFNSLGQMHVLNGSGAGAPERIIDLQMRSSVYAASTFAGSTMVCGDNYGNVYRVRLT
ncbi:hypothetical protein, unknown function [Leishmania tarentolae]|uniref:EF-hand domain-containing protein n=1 Tax=Leishmania tarentolae TaxID=5689 RepID=A0A640KJV6_LEITA|nr:hypothetical protein, unknown function [Leishmania tarentolae]